MVVWGGFSVQFSSVAQSCPTVCDPMDCSTPGLLSITNSRSLLKLMTIESVMPSNHFILCRPLLLPPSIFPSIKVSSNESVLHIRCPKDWASGRMHWWKFCSFNTVLPCPPSLVSFPSSAGRLWQEPALLFDFLNCSIIALPGKSHGRRSLVGCSPWGR